jgi:hypothetical protein
LKALKKKEINVNIEYCIAEKAQDSLDDLLGDLLDPGMIKANTIMNAVLFHQNYNVVC